MIESNISSERFTSVLREWAEVFMRQSMHEFVRLSKQSGISLPQLSVLFRLYHGGACGVSDIGDRSGISNAAASQMIDRLVQQGLLERAEDPSDRRGKIITLPGHGRMVVEESIEARRRWIEQLTAALTIHEQEAIAASLQTLTQAARLLESVESIPPSA
jgi:DNA-binding MarR family transcriptional regulator